MAIKHQEIIPVRLLGLGNTPSTTYTAGGTIVKGAPVVFSSGQVVEASDNDAGAGGAGTIVGFASHDAVSGDDVRVEPALPAQRFRGSLTDIAASVASDGGTKALAVADIGTVCELHKDDTTETWVLGATGGANACAVIVALIDPVGATTDDTPNFGSPNTGTALVEFIVQVADTIFA